MKLLKKEEVAAQRQAEQAREIFRNEQLKEATQKRQQDLNEVEAMFSKRMNEQRKQWVEEEAKALKEIETLQKLLADYQTKERSYFFPIDAIERKTHDNYERSKNILADTTEKQEECDLLEEKLHDRLDEVSEHETDLDKREQQIASHEQGISDQQTQTKQLSQALAKEWEKFHARVKAFEDSSAQTRKVLDLAQESLATREDQLLEKQEEVRIEKLRLLDGRNTLTRAWAELERKQYEKNINDHR